MAKSKTVARVLSLSLTLAMVGQTLAFGANPDVLTGDVRITVTPANVQETIPIPGANRTVNMSFHGVAVQDALRALAKKGGYSVLIDESVQGDVSVDLKNVTIQDALETLKTYANLAYSVEGNKLMVADASSEKGQAMRRSSTRIIPLRYANARMIANILNNTVFANTGASASGGGSGGASAGGAGTVMPVTADVHTNSLIVVGTPTDIKAVQEHVAALDQPREMKTWRLSQADVLDVATILASSLFNEGQPILTAGGGGGGASGAPGGALPASVRAVAENLEEGEGSSTAQTPSSEGSSSESVATGLTVRAKVKENVTIQVSPNGPIIIPDTRLNTLTLLGTAEQIAMAESMIPNLDRKLPQVVIEASLVEVNESASKELGYSMGFDWKSFGYGSNNDPTSTVPQRRLPGLADLTTNPDSTRFIGIKNTVPDEFQNVLSWSTLREFRKPRFAYQLNNLVKNQKAKILANPTIVLTHDAEGVISIVDEIIRSVTVTIGTNGAAPQFETEIGEAGIVMNLLPRVGADGSINLRVRPTVSTVIGTELDADGNVITLLSRRELLNQNITMHDGETLVLGGLISETNTEAVSRDPFLSKLPVVGALARNSSRSKDKTELVIMITPHIMNDQESVAQGSRIQPVQPAVLGKARPAGGMDNIIPVAESGYKYTPSVLPPLEKPHSIGDTTPSLQSASGTRSLKPQPLNADELGPATTAVIPPGKVNQSTPAWANGNTVATPAVKSQVKLQAAPANPPEPLDDVAPLESITNLKEKSMAPPPKEPTMALRSTAEPPKSLKQVDDDTIREIMSRFR